MSELHDVLVELGKLLEFEVRREVEASDSAFVDLVWFDNRIPVSVWKTGFHLRYVPVLPVVGFEIELKTALNAKHVKGSVSNLSNLGAQLGVVVIGKDNFTQLAKTYPKETQKQLKRRLRDRVYRWVYAEAQPKVRIVIMFEDEILTWLMQTKTLKTMIQPAVVAPVVTVEPAVLTSPAIALGES